MNAHRLLLLLILPLIATGCETDPTFGGAVKHNYAQQIVYPDPEYRGDELEGGSGTGAVRAHDAYRKGKVKQPVAIPTTTISTQGGGSDPTGGEN